MISKAYWVKTITMIYNIKNLKENNLDVVQMIF